MLTWTWELPERLCCVLFEILYPDSTGAALCRSIPVTSLLQGSVYGMPVRYSASEHALRSIHGTDPACYVASVLTW